MLFTEVRDAGGIKSCKLAAFYIAIISYALCGLLVLYGACLCIMSCVPKQPPVNIIDSGFDEKLPTVQQSRHVPQDPQIRFIGLDIEKQHPQPYSVRSRVPAVRFVDKPRLAQQQPQVQIPSYSYVSREQSEYGQPYRPTIPGGPSVYSKSSPIDSYREDSVVRPHALPRMASPITTPSRRPWPPNAPYAEPILRAITPGSEYSNNSRLSSVEFAARTTSPPPLAAQIDPIRSLSQRQSALSYTNSVYSIGSYSRNTMVAPPVPPLRPGFAQAAPRQQSELARLTNGRTWS